LIQNFDSQITQCINRCAIRATTEVHGGSGDEKHGNPSEQSRLFHNAFRLMVIEFRRAEMVNLFGVLRGEILPTFIPYQCRSGHVQQEKRIGHVD